MGHDIEMCGCSLYPSLKVVRGHYVMTSHAGTPLAVWDARLAPNPPPPPPPSHFAMPHTHPMKFLLWIHLVTHAQDSRA